MAKTVDLLDSKNQKFDPGASGMSSSNAQDGIIEAYNNAGGASTFVALSDTPNDYAGQSGKYVTVGVDQLVFSDAPTGAGEANRGENLAGAGAEVYAGMNGVNLTFREFVGGSTKLQVTQNANDISLDVVEGNILHQNLNGAGTNTHAQIDFHLQATNNPHSTAYNDLLGVPATFPPDPHTHVLADITDSGTAAAVDVPVVGDAAVNECVVGSDSRLTDARAPTVHTHVEADITDLDRVRWRDEFVNGTTYELNDMSREGEWTGVANKQTTDHIAPQLTGDEGWLSDLANGVTPPLTLTPQTAVNDAVLLSGQTWDFPIIAEINQLRYRVPDITGSFVYELWLVTNIGTPQETTQQILSAHTPLTTDWISVSIGSRTYAPNTTLSVVLLVRPATQDQSFSANWDVQNINGDPSSGKATFQNNEIELRVHNTDNDAVDRSANLQAVKVGATISYGGVNWTVTEVNIQATYVGYYLAPQQSRPVETIYSVSFAWSSAALLPNEHDSDYFAASNRVNGFTGPDLNSLVPNQHGYGVDFYTADYAVSPDWDIVAATGGATGGNVKGPTSSVDNNLALFDGVSGERIKDGGVGITDVFQSNVPYQFIPLGVETPPSPLDFLMIERNSDGVKKAVSVNDLPYVTGPNSAADSNLALYNGTAGDILKDDGIAAADLLRSSVPSQFAALGQEASPTNADFLVIERQSDGAKKYVNWSQLPSGGGGGDVEEAPIDGLSYTRRNAVWQRGSAVFNQAADPVATAQIGDVWIPV